MPQQRAGYDPLSDPYAGDPLSDPYAGDSMPMDLTKLSPVELVRSGRGPAEIQAELKRRERERTAAGARAVPTVMGAVGGIAGGIPGAAIGGALGEAVKQGVLREQGDTSVPSTPQGQVKDMALEGGLQGAAQGVGNLVGAGVRNTATYLMNRATTRVSAKLAEQFPNLSQELIDNAIAISKGGESKARMMLKLASDKVTKMLGTADKESVSIPIKMTPELADSFKTMLMERAAKSGATKVSAQSADALTSMTERLPDDVKALIAKAEQAAQNGDAISLTPTQAHFFKKRLQDESKALYRNITAMNGPNANTQEATVRAEMASRLRDALDGIVAGYKAGESDVQKAMLMRRGVTQALRPSGNVLQAMMRPAVGSVLGGSLGYSQKGSEGVIPGAVIGAAATSPAGMSREAIVLGHPIVRQALSQLPRATATALEQLLAQWSPKQNSGGW